MVIAATAGALTLLTVAAQPRGTYGRIETSFGLAPVGNPFDWRQDDVRVTFAGPDGAELTVPAFWDGDGVWRARHAPDRPGTWRVAAVTRNGQAVTVDGPRPAEFAVAGPARPGFIRLDPADPRRLVHDDGSIYYPLGCNIGWQGRGGSVEAIVRRLGEAGGNWARVWMCHWDGKNLDWRMGERLPVGELWLESARRWDAILDAGEEAGVAVQICLQHHGQYSTTVNPNWGEHPWNTANGGWLERPELFFTDTRAKELTAAKYRYIIARWGGSPAVCAWELFNEVQFVDAAREQLADVAAWHAGMAAFFRAHDPWRHLVTSSSDLNLTGVFDAMDYLQPHAYPNDALRPILDLDAELGRRAAFLGEIGPGGNLWGDGGRFLRRALWAGLMSQASGLPGYWMWELVDTAPFYPLYRSAAEFLRASRLADARRPAKELAVATAERGPLRLEPGGDWQASQQTSFVVPPDGHVEGLGRLSRFLQGNAHRAMTPQAELRATWPADGTFAVDIAVVARSGAGLAIAVDGVEVLRRDYPAAAFDQRTNLREAVPVAAGEHVITVTNPGNDWVNVAAFELSPYVPTVMGLAKGDDAVLAGWFASTLEDGAVAGRVSLAAADGPWRVTWWDIAAGAPLRTETVTARDGRLELTLPEVPEAVALWAERR